MLTAPAAPRLRERRQNRGKKKRKGIRATREFIRVPDAGGPCLAEAGVPLHRCPVASSRAADPPATAGCGQEALPEVLRHESVNDRIYAAGMQRVRGDCHHCGRVR